MQVIAGKEVGETDSIMLEEPEQASISSHPSSRTRGLPLSNCAQLSCSLMLLVCGISWPFSC